MRELLSVHRTKGSCLRGITCLRYSIKNNVVLQSSHAITYSPYNNSYRFPAFRPHYYLGIHIVKWRGWSVNDLIIGKKMSWLLSLNFFLHQLPWLKDDFFFLFIYFGLLSLLKYLYNDDFLFNLLSKFICQQLRYTYTKNSKYNDLYIYLS